MRSRISHGCDLPFHNTSSITIKNLKLSLLGTQPFVCNSLACRTSVHFILGLNANFSLHPHPHLKLDDALCCLFAEFKFNSSLFPVALSTARFFLKEFLVNFLFFSCSKSSSISPPSAALNSNSCLCVNPALVHSNNSLFPPGMSRS